MPSQTPAPVPTEDTLKLVAAYLDQHRLVTADCMLPSDLSQGGNRRRCDCESGVQKRRRIADALNTKLLAFFHPLTGGPTALGWPFGGKIYFSDTSPPDSGYTGKLAIEAGTLKTFGTTSLLWMDRISNCSRRIWCTRPNMAPGDLLMIRDTHNRYWLLDGVIAGKTSSRTDMFETHDDRYLTSNRRRSRGAVAGAGRTVVARRTGGPSGRLSLSMRS